MTEMPVAARGAPAELRVTASGGFTAWMAEHDASFAFTTYADGTSYFVGLDNGGDTFVLGRGYDRTLGLTATPDTVVMSTQFQIWQFQNALADGQVANGFDKVYVPQVAYTTGDVLTHDVTVDGQGTILFVNTLFSCLAAVSAQYSFSPIWHPPFISDLRPDDRCHLTGLAMDEGSPRFVTLAAQTDEPAGWRNAVKGSGCVMDVRTNDVVAADLTLPSSPRLLGGQLWLHEAGSGYFGTIDLQSGKFQPIAFCPGFPRGLSFIGNYAIAAASRVWEGQAFGGLPLADNLKTYRVTERNAILIIDLSTGELAHWMRVDGGASEIYDLVAVAGVRRPAAIDLKSSDMRRVLSVAPERQQQAGA